MTGPFFDRLDALDAAGLEHLVRRRLARLTRWAKLRSPFYRDRIRPVETPEELAELPLLDKDQVREHTPPRGRGLLTGPLRAASVFKSGGTTGKPRYSFFSRADWRRLARSAGRTLWAGGLRPGDRVANLFAVGELYASFLAMDRGLEEVGAVSFPFSFRASQEQVLEHLADFGIDCVMGIASMMVRLCDAAADAGVPVRKIFYAAEHLYPGDRRRLEERLSPEVIATAGYAAVDAGMIGYQCPACAGSVHHVLPGSAVVEILDEEGRPAAEGEVVVTHLERFLMPVIRYRVGDRARWVPGSCPCGRLSPRFELLGRGDDQLRIGYDTVTYEDLLAAVAAVEGLSTAAEMVKRREGGKDRLLVRVERRSAGSAGGEAFRLRESLLARKPLLAQHVREGYIHDLHIEILSPGGLPRLSHSGKLRRVRDESYG